MPQTAKVQTGGSSQINIYLTLIIIDTFWESNYQRSWIIDRIRLIGRPANLGVIAIRKLSIVVHADDAVAEIPVHSASAGAAGGLKENGDGRLGVPGAKVLEGKKDCVCVLKVIMIYRGILYQWRKQAESI